MSGGAQEARRGEARRGEVARCKRWDFLRPRTLEGIPDREREGDGDDLELFIDRETTTVLLEAVRVDVVGRKKDKEQRQVESRR